MDWHAVIGIIAALIQVVAIIPYIKDILRGTTRPNLVSWSLWTLAVLISAIAQIVSGPSWSVAILVTATLINFSVVSLAVFGYGYSKFGKVEGVCLSFSLLALLLWRLTSDPIVAIVFAIAADFVAYIPTIVKTYKDPFSETPIFWFLLFTVGAFGAISSTKANAANLMFPIYYAVINFALWALISVGRRVRDSRKPI